MSTVISVKFTDKGTSDILEENLQLISKGSLKDFPKQFLEVCLKIPTSEGISTQKSPEVLKKFPKEILHK